MHVVSQFIFHIKTASCRTVQFSIKTVPGGQCSLVNRNTGCPTGYRTRHFFNNYNTNEDIAKKFDQEYDVRNGKECVCSAPNSCDTERRSANRPASSVVSGTRCITVCLCNYQSLNCDDVRFKITSCTTQCVSSAVQTGNQAC